MEKEDAHFIGPFNPDKLLFSASIEVSGHVVKKNGKTIGRRWGSGNSFAANGRSFTPFIMSTNKKRAAESFLVWALRERAGYIHLDKAIDYPVWALFRFFFAAEDFYTVKKQMSLTIGDQSNLYQAPEDALQKAKIIKSDALIRSHCLSTCLPGEKTRLDIYLLPYEESPAWIYRNSLPRA